MSISNCPKRLEMTWNRFVSLLEVSLQSLGFLGCSEGEPGGGYICPKLVARVSEILYPLLNMSDNFAHIGQRGSILPQLLERNKHVWGLSLF